MKYLNTLNAACNRLLNRFSRKVFFAAFVVTSGTNFLLAYTVPGYTSFYLSSLGGFFFGMMFAKREPRC
jgi:fucose permease